MKHSIHLVICDLTSFPSVLERLKIWNSNYSKIKFSHWDQYQQTNYSNQDTHSNIGIVIAIFGGKNDIPDAEAHSMLWYLSCRYEYRPEKPPIILVQHNQKQYSLRTQFGNFHFVDFIDRSNKPLHNDLISVIDSVFNEYEKKNHSKFSTCVLQYKENREDEFILYLKQRKRIFHKISSPSNLEIFPNGENSWHLVPFSTNGKPPIPTTIDNIMSNHHEDHKYKSHLIYQIGGESPAEDFINIAEIAESKGWIRYRIPLKGSDNNTYKYAHCLQQPRPQRPPENESRGTVRFLLTFSK